MVGARQHYIRFRLLVSAVVLLFVSSSKIFCSAQDDEYSKLFQSAAAHTQAGEFEQAAADYQAALQLRPNAPEAWSNLAVVLYQMQRYSEAYADAARVWREHPELKSAALIAGMSAVQCNRPQDAVAPLEALLRSSPDNRDALLALASAYFGQQELARAATIYQRLLSRTRKDVVALYGFAICNERQAELASKKLAHMPGGRTLSKQMLANYLQGIGDDRLAAEAFGESVSDAEQPSAAAEQLYQTAQSSARQAQHAFEELVAAAPESWQAQVFLGDVSRQHSDFLSALKHYNQALSTSPQNPAALLGLGTVYWELGNFEDAIPTLQKAYTLNPSASEAIFEMGNIAVRQHKESEAIPLLKQYLELQPDALAAKADLGRAYLHEGRFSDAAKELAAAVPVDEQGDIHYQLSVALRKLGRASESEAALKESTRLRQKRIDKDEHRHSTNPASH